MDGPATRTGVLTALREAGVEILNAEEAHRLAPTLDNVSRLARARRAMETALKETDARP